MAHYEEDYEYEPERKSHFWSKFLAVLLGFILGLICTLGGLAGLGYVLFAKIKIKDGFDTVNKITHIISIKVSIRFTVFLDFIINLHWIQYIKSFWTCQVQKYSNWIL